MIDLLFIVSLFIEIYVLSKIDRIRFGTWLTPFHFLAVPYLVILTLAFLISEKVGLIPLYIESISIWLFGLFAFWVGGFSATLIFNKKLEADHFNQNILFEDAIKPIIYFLSWTSILVLFFSIQRALSEVGGLVNIGTAQFQKTFSEGIFGWFRVLCEFLLIYFIGSYKKRDWLKLLSITLSIFLLLLFQVKGSIILPITAGLIYRIYCHRLKFSFKLILTIPAIFLVIFVLISAVGYIGFENSHEILLNTDFLSDLAIRLVGYVFAGVLSLGDAVEHGIEVSSADRKAIYAPIMNLLRHASGDDRVINVTEYYSSIGTSVNLESNVHTLMGTLVLFLGYLHAMLYLLFLGFFSYMLFALVIKSRITWFFAFYCYILAALFFGWFEYYFWHALFFQSFMFSLFLTVIAYMPGNLYSKGTRFKSTMSKT